MSAERVLHHFPFDPGSRQVRLALGEKKLPFAEVLERYWEEGSGILALNPSGLPPVLVERTDRGQLVVCEPRPILEDLEERFPTLPLLPRDAGERAEARRLAMWFDGKFNAEVNSYLLHEKMEKRLMRLGAPELAAIRHGREALRAHLTVLEALLAERDWMAGRRLSHADLAAGGHLSVLDYFGETPWNDFPALKTWYMRLKSRPSFRPLLLDRLPGVQPAAHYHDLDF